MAPRKVFLGGNPGRVRVKVKKVLYRKGVLFLLERVLLSFLRGATYSKRGKKGVQSGKKRRVGGGARSSGGAKHTKGGDVKIEKSKGEKS